MQLNLWYPCQLEDVLRSMGMKPTEHQLEEIINELDQNRDGSIEFAEFLRVMAVPKRGSAAFKLMSRVSRYLRACTACALRESAHTQAHFNV